MLPGDPLLEFPLDLSDELFAAAVNIVLGVEERAAQQLGSSLKSSASESRSGLTAKNLAQQSRNQSDRNRAMM